MGLEMLQPSSSSHSAIDLKCRGKASDGTSASAVGTRRLRTAEKARKPPNVSVKATLPLR